MQPAITAFQQTVMDYYYMHGRHDLPWRQPDVSGSLDPYKIIVSEIMLQQTQVPRVLPKFLSFMSQFPTVQALATAPLGDVLRAWSGLGYNRRAKFLWQAAQAVVRDHGGVVPDTIDGLASLPGIGKNTAGAVLAYAYNKPVVFIETNIRSAFIHHFFSSQETVHDRDIADVVAQAVPDNTREWYWALMDYGTYLKQTTGNAAKRSVHYTKQSTFAGSKRQVRGKVLKLLGEGHLTPSELAAAIPDDRLPQVLEELEREQLITKHAKYYSL